MLVAKQFFPKIHPYKEIKYFWKTHREKQDNRENDKTAKILIGDGIESEWNYSIPDKCS